MRIARLVLGVLLLTLIPSGASADPQSSWYVGVAAGVSDTSVNLRSLFGDLIHLEVPNPQSPVPTSELVGDLDSQRDSLSITLGHRIGRHLRLEAELSRLGATSPVATTLRVTDFSVQSELKIGDSIAAGAVAIPELPLTDQWSAYAKLGWRLARLQLEVDVPARTSRQPVEERIDGPVLGAGFLWRRSGPFDFFAEVERWEIDGGPAPLALPTDRPGNSISGSETRVLLGSLVSW